MRTKYRGVKWAIWTGVATAFAIPSWSVAETEGISPQVISLPSGAGSIEGYGESFEPQLNTGTFTFSVPFNLPTVRGDVGPSFSLNYNSANGNGCVGMGWKLSIPYIQLQTDKGLPRYEGGDSFIDASGEELVLTQDGTYRIENEGSFRKFEKILLTADPDGPIGWRVHLPNGVVYNYGMAAQSRLDLPADRVPAGGNGTFCWMLESAEDTNGNRAEYTYFKEEVRDGEGVLVGEEIYCDKIIYGLHSDLPSEVFEVRFAYEGGRVDPIMDFRPRFCRETRLRLNTISAHHGARRIRLWRLEYQDDCPVTLLKRFTGFGDERSSTGAGAQLNRDFLPAMEFDYTPCRIGDVWELKNVADAPPVLLDNGEAVFVDIDQDSLPDILHEQNGELRSYLNLGRGMEWGDANIFASVPGGFELASGTTRLADMRGNASVDVLWNRGEGLSEYSYFSFASPAAFDLGDGDGTPWDTQVPINDPEVQLVDINFDKAIDIMQTDSQNGFCYVINGQVEGGANTFIDNVPSQAEDLGVQFSDGWQFADVNGDRLQDLVKLQTQEDGGGVLVHYNSGWGGFEKRLIMTGGPIGSEVQIDELHLSDINQDGLSDCIQVREGLVRIWLNKDSRGWDDPILIEPEDLHIYPNTAIRFVDINGNGSSDIVLSSIDAEADVPMQFLELQPEGKPYQMNAMQNGIGRTLQIEYRDAVEYYLEAKETTTPDDDWDSVIPFNLPVVGAFVESDGLGGVYRTEFSYRNGYYDAKEKELRGFERATKREIGDATSPTLVTQFEFFTGEQQEALKGMTKMTQTETEAGQVFSRVSNDWVARPLGLEAAGEDPITYAYVEREVTDVIEKGSGTPVMLEKLYEYDDYGNMTRSTDFGRVENGNRSAWDDERVTVGGFTAAHPSGIANWILNLQVWQEIQDENGTAIARTEHYYDDQSFGAGDPGSVSAGNLTLTRAFIDPAAGTFVNSVRNEYDAYGNVTGIYDPLGQAGDASAGHYREVVYDGVIHSHPIREIVHTANPLPGSPQMVVVEADYDLGLGVVSASRNPNGHQTSYEHDTFGRLVSIVKPGDSIAAPTTEFDYVLAVPLPGDALINYVETRQRESAGGGTIDSRTYSDGLGRKIMTRSEGEDPGQIVVTDTVQFNARRGEWKKYLPYFDSGGLAFVDPSFQSGFLENHYDAQGRVRQTFQPLLAGAAVREFSQVAYLPLEMQTRDEEQTKPGSAHFGAYLSAQHDGLSGAEDEPRVRYSDQYVKISDAGEVTGSLVPWRTEYVYDLLNNVTQITDSQGNIKWARFDGLSRKTWIDDPDRGQLTTVYDDASNVLESRDAKNQWIRYTYDGANRALTEDYSDTPNGLADVHYHFDVAAGALADGLGNQRTADNLLGVVAYIQDLSGEEHQSYDERGRLSWQIKRIKSFAAGELRNFYTGFQYDSADRQALISYPDGDAVSYTYDPRGTLDTVVSASTGPLLTGCDYISSGKFAAKRYGNGVATAYRYDNRLRLIDLETESPAERLLDYNYTLDGVSNITAVADERPGGSELENSQNFQYDNSYRLLQVRYPESDADEINYRYDRIGNIVSKRSNIVHLDRGNSVTDLGVMGYGSSAGAWNRNGDGEAEGLPGPGAVTSVEDGGRSYAYDANGNMVSIEGMICQWDVKDRLSGTSRDGTTTNYTYDFSDRRIGKSTRSPGTDPSARFYVNKYYEVEGTSDTKYFFAGAERIAKLEDSTVDEDRQTVELRIGWNLFALRVGGVSGSDLLTGGAAGVVAYSLSLTTGDYLEIAANTALSPGSIIWMWTPEAGRLNLEGTAPVEAPPAWNGEPGLFANTGLQPVRFESTSFFLSRFVSTEQRWSTRIEEAAEVNPGEVVRLERKEGEGWPSSASTVAPALAFYHSDHLGSTSIQTDAAGMAKARSINYPYGWERASAGEGEIRYGFTGKEQDGETDLHYFEARYYAAHLGRFISVDPILEEGGMNVYAYTTNNPMVYIDPTGLEKVVALGLDVNGGVGFLGFTGGVGTAFALNADNSEYEEGETSWYDNIHIYGTVGGGGQIGTPSASFGGAVSISESMEAFSGTSISTGGSGAFAIGAGVEVHNSEHGNTLTFSGGVGGGGEGHQYLNHTKTISYGDVARKAFGLDPRVKRMNPLPEVPTRGSNSYSVGGMESPINHFPTSVPGDDGDVASFSE